MIILFGIAMILVIILFLMLLIGNILPMAIREWSILKY